MRLWRDSGEAADRPGTRQVGGAHSIGIVFLACTLAGCVTSKKYRLAKPDTPAAQALNLSIVTDSLQLDVVAVIVFKGPGSWKREARWDEYVVTFTSHGEQSVIVDSAELIDLQGHPRVPGVDPWVLEKLSRSNWEKYGKTGLHVVEGVGAAALYVSTAAAVAESAYAGVAAGGVAVLSVVPVIGLVDVSAVAVMNHQNKTKVQTEFQRRRLKLPVTVTPAGPVSGSLFFPMTPGPQRLVVRGHSSEQPLEAVLELQPLANLHLKAAK